MKLFSHCITGLLLSALCAGAAHAATVKAELTPASATRADQVKVRITVQDRVAGDRITHYMLWMADKTVPNALRIEGDNTILTEDKNSEIPLDVSWWPDGKYTILVRAYYYKDASAPFERLDTQAQLILKGGPEAPQFSIIPNKQTLTAGDPLELTLRLQSEAKVGEVIDSVLVSHGQQISAAQLFPLDQTEQEVTRWRGASSGRIDTAGWREQRLNTLQVHAKIKNSAGKESTLIVPVPPIMVQATSSSSNQRLMTSYRGDRPIHLVTTEQAMNTFAYPTCTSWRYNGTDVFVESDRPRPDGTHVQGEHQLLMINTQTGQTTHLATLAVEDLKQYGDYDTRGVSVAYHFDYAAKADLLVYYDMTSHHMCTLRPGGTPVEILHETQGRIGDPPSISPDGKHVLYYVVFNGPLASRFFYGRTSGVFVMDLDPQTGRAISEPRMILTYPWRNALDAKSAVSPRDFVAKFIAVNHVQFNPQDPSMIMYAHEGTYPRDGSLENTRIWHMNSDGTDNHSLAPAQEVGTYYTHEVYGPLGKYVYMVWGRSVARIDVKTNKFETIFKKEETLQALHIGISPDEKWIAADMISGFGLDNDGNAIGGLFLIETATGKANFLAAFPAGHAHPRHPHPNFSPDGTRIGFTVAQGADFSQAAYIDVSDIVKAKSH